MSQSPEMIKCPFTGKMIPRPASRKLDLVDPKVLPAEVTPKDVYPTEYNACLAQLKELRTHFAALQPGQRQGAKGDKIMRQYRHESLKLMHLAGEKAPPIYDEM